MIDLNSKDRSDAQYDSEAQKSSKSNAHDKRYRRLFSNPLIIEELMKYFVDEKFTNELDFSQMELQNTSFINEEHKKSEADMIWKIKFKGNDVYVYLLIEFQSTVDKYMALRFGSYILEFYKWLIRQQELEKLPAVFPVLIYNGKRCWTAQDNIKDMGPIIDKMANVQEVKTMFIDSVEEYKEKIIQESMEKGMQKGKQKWFEQGMYKKAIDAAVKMLQMGMAIEVISKVTGLSREEIEELRLN